MAYKIIFTADKYVEKLLNIIYNLKTTYSNTVDKTTQTYYNCGYHGMSSYMFDCWNWHKVLWWGWTAGYNVGSFLFAPGTNGIGDWNGRQILDKCSGVSSDFKSLVPGEWLLTKAEDHAGVYIGKHTWNGYEYNVAECTPKITRNGNLIMSSGCHLSYVDEKGNRYNHKGGTQVLAWAYHGKLPWIDYTNGNAPLKYTIKTEGNKQTINVTEGKGTITVVTTIK